MVHDTKNVVDLRALLELARARNIKVIEVGRLEDDRCGLRFQKSGVEWIALKSGISENEKVRALGFLLEHDSSSIGIGAAEGGVFGKEQVDMLSLRCPCR